MNDHPPITEAAFIKAHNDALVCALSDVARFLDEPLPRRLMVRLLGRRGVRAWLSWMTGPVHLVIAVQDWRFRYALRACARWPNHPMLP